MRNHRSSGSFTRRMMLLQLGVVGGIVALCVVAAGWLTAERVHDQAEQEALGIARTLAADPEIRAAVAVQADIEDLDAGALRVGPVQLAAQAALQRTGALFVVVTEDRGFRLSHPNPELVGGMVSTEPTALGGTESVSRDQGTLGESVRAKVPVFAPVADPAEAGRVVGEVSIGVAIARVDVEVRQAVLSVLVIGVVALALGAVAVATLVRRLRRMTLGLEPEEMAQLIRDQEAVLYGVDDGVIGIGPDGRITLRNRAAREMLGLPQRTDPADVVGLDFHAAGLPDGLVRTIEAGVATPTRLELPERVVLAGVRDVVRDGSPLGVVVMLRDVTAVESLGSRLDAVETMASALRAQRHEFANRLHTVSGLLQGGEVEHARSYLGEIIESGPLREPVENIGAVRDTYLRAFLGAKGVQAHERGVALRVGEGTAIGGTVVDAQDVTAVLGNLVDNALHAAVSGTGADGRWVEVDLLGDGDTLHLAVADSGDGVLPGFDAFAEGATTRQGAAGAEHGHGLGLALSRRLARQRGGDVWIADPGGTGDGGAVVCARLPGVLSRPGTTAAPQPERAADPTGVPGPASGAGTPRTEE